MRTGRRLHIGQSSWRLYCAFWCLRDFGRSDIRCLVLGRPHIGVGTGRFFLYHRLRKAYHIRERVTKRMRKQVLLIVLGVLLVTALGGCKKGG